MRRNPTTTTAGGSTRVVKLSTVEKRVRKDLLAASLASQADGSCVIVLEMNNGDTIDVRFSHGALGVMWATVSRVRDLSVNGATVDTRQSDNVADAIASLATVATGDRAWTFAVAHALLALWREMPTDADSQARMAEISAMALGTRQALGFYSSLHVLRCAGRVLFEEDTVLGDGYVYWVNGSGGRDVTYHSRTGLYQIAGVP